jgi:SAM-dependent methyltransferase
LKNIISLVKTVTKFILKRLVSPSKSAVTAVIPLPTHPWGDVCSEAPLNLEGGYIFGSLSIGRNKDVLLGISNCRKFLIKIGITRIGRKSNDILAESEIIRRLNQAGCLSCPKLVESGTISASKLTDILVGEARAAVGLQREGQLNWFIQEYIESLDYVPFADIVFSILEQKNLGVFQGDIKPANLRFGSDGVCYIVDYDQAALLSEEISQLGFHEFMRWTCQREREKYGFPTWMRHFPTVHEKYLNALFRNSAFDLSRTTLYRRQATTNTPNGVYHTLAYRDLFADGIRTLDDRIPTLDQLSFGDGEKVLDVGCNAGLLSMYLEKRGCDVTGGEMDESLVKAACMVNNILCNNIRFIRLNLDLHPIPAQFDTILLFSVIHHSKNLKENGRKIANACNRIIIECRLREGGKAPVTGTSGIVEWRETSSWNYNSLSELNSGLEDLFPGFKIKNNLGAVDKQRSIIELIKES